MATSNGDMPPTYANVERKHATPPPSMSPASSRQKRDETRRAGPGRAEEDWTGLTHSPRGPTPPSPACPTGAQPAIRIHSEGDPPCAPLCADAMPRVRS
jgi:hypothetical protein